MNSFGNTPAGIYLAFCIKDSRNLRRKISSKYSDWKQILNDVYSAHLSGEIRMTSLIRILEALDTQFKLECEQIQDLHIRNLFSNVIRGEFKVLRRRYITSRRRKKGTAIPIATETSKVEYLKEKSNKRLAKYGKVSNLY